jgi:hypothetical protein
MSRSSRDCLRSHKAGCDARGPSSRIAVVDDTDDSGALCDRASRSRSRYAIIRRMRGLVVRVEDANGLCRPPCKSFASKILWLLLRFWTVRFRQLVAFGSRAGRRPSFSSIIHAFVFDQHGSREPRGRLSRRTPYGSVKAATATLSLFRRRIMRRVDSAGQQPPPRVCYPLRAAVGV